MSTTQPSPRPKWEPTRYPGIRTRHANDCGTLRGGRCSCAPLFKARVWIAREQRQIEKSHPTLAAARSWQRDAQRLEQRGALRSPAQTTVREAVLAWLELAEAGEAVSRSRRPYKPSTLRGYRVGAAKYVLPALGEMRLSDLSRSDVQELADKLRAGGMAPSSVHNALDVLRAVCRHAVARDVLAANPTQGLDLEAGHPVQPRERIAGPQEAAALIGAVPEPDRATWATALYAGLRRGELRALQRRDVDLEAGVIRVRRSYDDGGAGEPGSYTAPKTRRGERQVPVLAVLRPHLAAALLACGPDPEALVLGRDGRPFVSSSLRHRALTAWKRAELEPIRLHECRHTFASLLIAAGTNIKAVSEALGHASVAFTLDVYGHLLPGAMQDVARLADAWLEEHGG